GSAGDACAGDEVAGGRRALQRIPRAGVELRHQVPALGLSLEVGEQEGRCVVESLFVLEPLAGARGDLLTARREIFFERLGVASELGPELFDLAAQVPRDRLSVGSARLARLQPLLA